MDAAGPHLVNAWLASWCGAKDLANNIARWDEAIKGLRRQEGALAKAADKLNLLAGAYWAVDDIARSDDDE